MDDLELQDEPLQIRIMDYDTYSANDAIGKVWDHIQDNVGPTTLLPQVYIDLNPLLLPQPGQRPVSLTENSGVPLSATGIMVCIMGVLIILSRRRMCYVRVAPCL